MFDLFNPHCGTVVRHTEGTYDVNSDYTEGYRTKLSVRGDLQPLYKGNSLASKEQVILPAGANAEDSRRFYTKSKLRTVEQFDNTIADTISFKHIPNRTWVVFKEGDWGCGLDYVDHNCYVLVRLDQDAQR